MCSTRVVRRVNKVERSVLHWSVNTMCEFESAVGIERAVMREALRRVVEKYAYLRLRVEREAANNDDELVFVENSSQEIDGYEIGWNDEASDDWQTRLNIFGSREYTKRLFDIEIDRVSVQKFRLYFRISHVGKENTFVVVVVVLDLNK